MVYPPISHAMEEAALDAATTDDDGHQDEYKADENESYHSTNNDSGEVIPCMYE